MNRLMLGAVIAVLAAGCTTDWIHRMTRHDAAELTDFLPGKERLVRNPDTFPVHYSWCDYEAIGKAGFKNVYVAPVDLSYLRKGNGYDTWRDKVLGLEDAIADLGEYGHDAFVSAFKERKLSVADSPDAPGTAVLELAITAFVPTRSEIAAVGTVADLALPGLGIVSDYLSSGEIAVECRVRDAATKEVVLMFADAEGEPKALLQFSKFSYTSAAKINLKKIAKAFAESCVVEDASKLRREFPFSFISLPWDSRLND